MPVFFILSGITMNWTLANGSYCAKVKKLFQSLIIPAIWMLIIATLYDSIADLYSGHFNLSDDLSSLFTEIVWSSGVPFKIGHFTVTDLGMQWFLVVLFFDKTLIFLILYIHSKARRSRKKAIIIILLSLLFLFVGYILGRSDIWLPFSLDLALFTISYLVIGHYCKGILLNASLWKFLLSIMFWASTLFLQALFGKGYFELASRNYPLFPICYICSCAGSFALCYISQIINAKTRLYNVIKSVGQNSLTLFFIHKIDYWYRGWFVIICNNQIMCIAFRLITDLLVLYIVLTMKQYKKDKREAIESN